MQLIETLGASDYTNKKANYPYKKSIIFAITSRPLNVCVQHSSIMEEVAQR